MDAFWWIFLGGVLMSAIALVGSVTLLLGAATLERVITPLVAFAAGSLLGVPEVNKHREIGANVLHFACFVAGVALLWLIRIALEP